MPRTESGTNHKRTKALPSTGASRTNNKPKNPVRFQQAREEKIKNKEFGIDTNVLLDDPECIWEFGPRKDITLARTVIMEIDSLKKGIGERHRNARKIAEYLDYLTASVPIEKIKDGIPLIRPGENIKNGKKRGKLYLDVPEPDKRKEWLDPAYPDHKILLWHLERIERLQYPHSKRVFEIVSEDKIMRVFARLVGIVARKREKTAINVEDLNFTGLHTLPMQFWEKQKHKDLILGKTEARNRTVYNLKGAEFQNIALYEFLSVGTAKGKPPLILQVIERNSPQNVFAIETTDYQREAVYGLRARNLEQSLALSAMLYPGMQLVILEAKTGTGKTLLSLAAGCELLVREEVKEVVTTRVPVPLTRHDIGYVPGKERDKMEGWMQGTIDNFTVLQELQEEKQQNVVFQRNKEGKKRKQIELKDIKFIDINTLRGSSSKGKFIIIDEAQNCSEELMKAIITRAGEGTTIVLCGNFRQMDMPMSVSSSGLARAINMVHDMGERKKIISVHLTLPQIERSNLAAVTEEYFR